ncbi:hypothetical protein BGW42_002181 [Actinomortierella wolfii]|nr:hypothetical protein BGW42_002181 [Actinomortierella wolfii]
MSQHQKARWQTVGPHWNSVRPSPAGSTSSSPVVHHGFHSSYLNAISRPDLKRDDDTPSTQRSPTLGQSSTDESPIATSSSLSGVPPQYLEHHRQQQLYLQQLELMQKLQTMPGSTTRLWYPTFGPTVTTSCSDNTILLDNPHQYTLNNTAKLNRHAVGPHWRSIQTYSVIPSSTPSSPQSSSSQQTSSTGGSAPSPMAALYSSAASINQIRAASFRLHGEHADQDMSDAAARPNGGAISSSSSSSSSAPVGTDVQANYIMGHYAGVVRYPNLAKESHDYNHSHPHPTYPYYINTTPNYRERHESGAMSRSISVSSSTSMDSDSTALTSAGRSDMKRKVPWQDEDMYREGSDSEDSDHHQEHGHEHDHERLHHQGVELGGGHGGGAGGGASSQPVTQYVPVTQSNPSMATATSSSVTASVAQQLCDQDTDMTIAPSEPYDHASDTMDLSYPSTTTTTITTTTTTRGIDSSSPPRSSQQNNHRNSNLSRTSIDLARKESGDDLSKLKVRSSQDRSSLALSMALDDIGLLGGGGGPQQQQQQYHSRHLDVDHSISSMALPTTDYDQSQSRPIVQPRRTRIRRESDENDLASEARRQSGEILRDIFQECFYNAAASSR